MAAYLIANYTITDMDFWQTNYAANVIPTILSHGGEVLVAEPETEAVEGSPFNFTVVLSFPSMEALKGWWNSDEYQAIKHFRHESSKDGYVAFCNGFVMPD